MQFHLNDLANHVGEDLGTTDWFEITQERVNTFADATDDHQWIHVDVEAARNGPFGSTIAHGYLTLSLAPILLDQIFEITGTGMRINYGCNRVRFPSPVPVGAQIRLGARILEVQSVADNAVQLVVEMTITTDRSPKPAAVIEAIYRCYPE